MRYVLGPLAVGGILVLSCVAGILYHNASFAVRRAGDSWVLLLPAILLTAYIGSSLLQAPRRFGRPARIGHRILAVSLFLLAAATIVYGVSWIATHGEPRAPVGGIAIVVLATGTVLGALPVEVYFACRSRREERDGAGSHR